MASQYFVLNVNRVLTPEATESKPSIRKEKVMSYEEKTVGSTPFYKCEACPFMALAEDDIKFHLFTVHPALAKTNGLADNIQISCPGCTSAFDAEETLRNHLRNHHKMGLKDVKKMVKSLVQIALKNAKLKKEENFETPPLAVERENPDVQMPQVIEIVPGRATSETLPKGVAFISVDELNKMSTPNFENVDPKEIIQEASINIVYTSALSAQYVNNIPTQSSCNKVLVSNVPPDLIASIKPCVASVIDRKKSPAPEIVETNAPPALKPGRPLGANTTYGTLDESKLCLVDECHFRMKDSEKLVYHRKSHQNGKLRCLECHKYFLTIESLHTHLWKNHAIDMELPTCELCGYKTYKKYRLTNIHMKCHGNIKDYPCPICSNVYKNINQLSKHKLTHKSESHACPTCKQTFSSSRRLRMHVAAVHDKLRPFKCSHCSFVAARKEELKLHLRSHTGDKPYSCDRCLYRCADHNSMRRHKKTHGSVTGYSCKHCPYTTIQSTTFAAHMINKHPNVETNDVHRCPYCSFRTVNKDKYVVHLTTHSDEEGIRLLIEMTTEKNQSKPSWTIPSETVEKQSDNEAGSEQNKEHNTTEATIDVETYDCNNFLKNQFPPQDYSKAYNIANGNQQTEFNNQALVQDLSKEDNNSDCLISESSNDTVIDRHQYTPQLPLLTYDSSQLNQHGFLDSSVPIDQSLLQNSNVNSLATTHLVTSNRVVNHSIMGNFPIRLPTLAPAPQISLQSNLTLTPVDKISIPLTKVTGPIITPTQILPVPSLSNSPVNISSDVEGTPRKKPKISVKSNLILKGPDPVNMFQQKMAFRRLEDCDRFGLSSPVTFNNLITTQFMPEPALSESPNNIVPYPQETMLNDTATTPVDSGISNTSQIFSFNQQMNVNQMTMLPPPQKIHTSTASYIKVENAVKQNTQSPSLDRMCSANLLSTQAISREYKASPPLEDIHKNMNEIKNELKLDTFYNITLNSTTTNPPVLDQYLLDNNIDEQYPAHLDLSAAVLPEASDDQQNDVIEIDDNSDDNKLLSRYDINFPLESLYLMHSDFHFLDNDLPASNIPNEAVCEMNRMVTEVPITTQIENLEVANDTNDFPNFIHGRQDPMMNSSVRPTTNKINVKNIELMKN